MNALQYIGDGKKGFHFVNPISGVRYVGEQRIEPQVFEESEFMAVFNAIKKLQNQ